VDGLWRVALWVVELSAPAVGRDGSVLLGPSRPHAHHPPAPAPSPGPLALTAAPLNPNHNNSVEYMQRECAAKRIFVLPAFETPRVPDQAGAHRVAAQAVASSKRALEHMVNRKMVHQVRTGAVRGLHLLLGALGLVGD